MALECQGAGIDYPQYNMWNAPLTCSGVGKGSQQADWDVTHTISVGDGRWGTYTAPELPDFRVPAFWGEKSMKEKRVLIDTFTGRIYLVGPGVYELKLSRGSVQHDLVESSAGHLMLPCSRFDVPRKPYLEVASFIVGDYFENESARSVAKSGGSPPARNTSVAVEKGFQNTDNFVKLDDIFNRAHDELDMLVASAQSKRQD